MTKPKQKIVSKTSEAYLRPATGRYSYAGIIKTPDWKQNNSKQ